MVKTAPVNNLSLRYSHSYITSLDAARTCDDELAYDPPYDPTGKMIDDIYKDELIDSVEGPEREVLEGIMNDDENFLRLAHKNDLRESEIYTLKKRLQKKFKPLHEENNRDATRIVVLLWIMARLGKMTRHMYTIWNDEPTLREHKRPSMDSLTDFVEEALITIAGGDVTFKVVPKEDDKDKEINTPAEAVR